MLTSIIIKYICSTVYKAKEKPAATVAVVAAGILLLATIVGMCGEVGEEWAGRAGGGRVE